MSRSSCKRCPKCGETKDRSGFPTCKTRGDGLNSRCKACVKKYQASIAGTTDPGDSKVCTGCKSQLPIDQFYRNAAKRDGRSEYCKTCKTGICKRLQVDTPPTLICTRCKETKPSDSFYLNQLGKHRRSLECKSCQRSGSMKRRYGITLEQFDELVRCQNGGCRICGSRPPGVTLVVDHCHQTGAIRGILCGYCNTGLGFFKDNPDLCKAAENYLRETSCGEPIIYKPCELPAPKPSKQQS